MSSPYMERAIELSRNGFPAPNPHVGCVIVLDGVIVGEGHHEYAGGPHAEIVALNQAGTKARGADVFVSLEPCNHLGRTPPCSSALIEAGVKSVTVACSEPNPKAAGGAETLRSAGIHVESGTMESEARQANIRFMTAMEQRRPYVVVKAALTLDGRIARADGSSKWITGDLAREEAHRLRAEMGVVVVGRKTVEMDNPELTARIPGVTHQPLKVILDPHASLSGNEKVFTGEGLVWRMVAPGNEGASGAFACAVDANGNLDIRSLLEILRVRGATGVLVEGGGETIRRFLEAKVVNRIELFMAPKLFGEGQLWVGADHSLSLTDLKLEISQVRALGPDLQVSVDVS